MNCNVCDKETDSIMVICPECDEKKDKQIAQLQERLEAWREYGKLPMPYKEKKLSYKKLIGLGEV